MRRIYAIIAIAVSCLVMTTCKKDKDPVPPVFKFNEVEASGNSAKITGEYEYEGELKNLTLLYGKDPQLVDAGKKDVEVDGRLFSVSVDDLESETKYYYGIECKTTYSSIRTETESFMTKKTVSMAEVTTNEVTAVATSTATSGGTVTSDGNAAVTARGVCWSTSPYPTPEEDSFTEDGTGTGSFVSYISGLTENTKYYVRAYAANEKGTAYGEQKEFTTLSSEGLPTVTTNEVTDITTNSSTSGGNVTSDGNASVTAKGICWSTTPNPTIENEHTEDGTGIGSYVSYMTELNHGTKYYVRAYATNRAGTAYGEQKEFTTEVNEELPIVTTNDITAITETTATSGGNVTSDGNATVTARGVCWSTSQNPTINDNKTTDGSGTGSYTSNISNLTHNTKYYVRAYATNEKGTSYGEQKEFTTMVNESMPVVTTNEINGITQTTATSGGNVTSDGNAAVTARGVCWSTSQNPTIDDNKTTDGNGTGSFTSNITGLTANTTYYVRAYATNEKGTSYGEQKSFKTLQNIELPTVTTTNVSNITQTTATSGGNVTDDGGATLTARGVCWSTSQNPTISNSHTTDGNGTGSFTSNITGLTANTTYYVRAYATNEKGTSYGEQKSFTTLQNIELPTVTTTNVSNITQTTATSGGNVTDDGGANVTARGVCWSTSQNPTISNSHTTDGNGTGSFTSNMTGLTANTTYYVRAYATNEKGTSYGEQKSFTTLQNIELPTVTTTNVSNITQTTATSGGNVTSDGGANVTARGVCWSTSQNPTISNSHTTDGNGTGSFTSSITGLTANTTYYVRAYATNEKGTSYGEQKSFTTIQVFDETIDPNGNRIITLYGDVVFTMIKVEGSTFNMGAQLFDTSGTNYDSDANGDESPVHSVTLSDYYIGETEVTQELWEAVMGSNPSHFSGNQKPVEMVSWNDCKEFITNLNNLTGMNFRLPTEAEWEYAARGGNESQGYKYSGSNTIGNVAWYLDNSGNATHNVKTKSPNELGIYDMSGNVREWCEDWFGDYSSGSQTNPTGPSTGSNRVLRGGSWYNDAENCRVSSRYNDIPGGRSSIFGFRLALSQ